MMNSRPLWGMLATLSALALGCASDSKTTPSHDTAAPDTQPPAEVFIPDTVPPDVPPGPWTRAAAPAA